MKGPHEGPSRIREMVMDAVNTRKQIQQIRILTHGRRPDTATGTCLHKKISFFRILTRRRQPDTAAPSFEVANASYMQYKRQTLKQLLFQK